MTESDRPAQDGWDAVQGGPEVKMKRYNTGKKP